MKTKIKGKLLYSSLVMLIISIVSLTGVTFAWFKTSLNPKVESMQIEVISESSLVISTTPDGSFDNSVNQDDLFAEGNGEGNYKPSVTDAATLLTTLPDLSTYLTPSEGGINIKTKNTQGSYIQPNFALRDPSASTNNSTGLTSDRAYENIVKFNLYFRANREMVVSLDLLPNKTVFEWKNAAANNELVKAIRVGFVLPSAADSEVENMLIFEPDGSAYDREFAGESWSGEVWEEASDEFTNTAAQPYSSISRQAAELNNFKLPLFSISGNDVGESSSVKMTVYIWIEGFDPACSGSTAGGVYSAALNFVGTVLPNQG